MHNHSYAHAPQFIELLDQRLAEAAQAGKPLTSLAEALGHMAIAFALLSAEIGGRGGEESDPEELLEQLLEISTAAARAAGELVLPALPRAIL